MALTTTPSSVEVEGRVELYICSPSWAFVACSREIFTFTTTTSTAITTTTATTTANTTIITTATANAITTTATATDTSTTTTTTITTIDTTITTIILLLLLLLLLLHYSGHYGVLVFVSPSILSISSFTPSPAQSYGHIERVLVEWALLFAPLVNPSPAHLSDNGPRQIMNPPTQMQTHLSSGSTTASRRSFFDKVCLSSVPT